MKNLTNSIILLLGYLFLILGLAQIRYCETHVLYFQAAFLVLTALSVFAGFLHFGRYRLPLYGFLVFWGVAYLLTWQFYWRSLQTQPNVEEIAIQFILLEVAAGLAHNVGTHLLEFDSLFNSLSSDTYPNRTLQLDSAGDRIKTEITRSRRYSRPLSLLILKLDRINEEQYQQQLEKLEHDLFRRFAMAKVGQIINGHARQTDLIMRDNQGRFIVLCPETGSQDCAILAQRIGSAIQGDLGDKVSWGIASFPQETLEFDDLLHTATQRLNEQPEAADCLKEEPAERHLT